MNERTYYCTVQNKGNTPIRSQSAVLYVHTHPIVTQEKLIGKVMDITGTTIGMPQYLDKDMVVRQYTDNLSTQGTTYHGLEVTFETAPLTNHYVQAYAEVLGVKYPVLFCNMEQTDVTFTPYTSTGRFVLDPSLLSSSARRTNVTIYADMYDDITCTNKIESEKFSMGVVVDNSPPITAFQYNRYTHQLNIAVKDVLSGIESIDYIVAYEDGRTQTGSKTDSFEIAISSPATITVTAMDRIGNHSVSISKALTPSSPDGSTPDDELDDILPEGSENTSVYHYRTYNFDCYLVGGNKSNQ